MAIYCGMKRFETGKFGNEWKEFVGTCDAFDQGI